MPEDGFTAAVQELPESWQKCISAERRYFRERAHTLIIVAWYVIV